jgi:hypothetical protein
MGEFFTGGEPTSVSTRLAPHEAIFLAMPNPMPVLLPAPVIKMVLPLNSSYMVTPPSVVGRQFPCQTGCEPIFFFTIEKSLVFIKTDMPPE